VAAPALRAAPWRGLAAAACLALASPPGVFPGAELLVFPGLALLLDVACREKRPNLGLAVAGALYLLWLTWSVRFVTVVVILGVPALACLYFMGLGWLLRLSERRAPAALPLSFALLWALFEWLRSNQPEIPYPHGQVVHALYEWPWLLRPVRIVGEAGGNALVAALAAGLWCLVRRRSSRALSATAAIWLALALAPVATVPADGPPLRVAVVQTNVIRAMLQGAPDWDWERHMTQLRDRLPACDLVVWPETCYLVRDDYRQEEIAAGRLRGAGRLLSTGVPFLYGSLLASDIRRAGQVRHYVLGILANGAGDRVLGVHEKTRLVPAGERMPFLESILPESWYAAFLDWLRQRFPFVPSVLEGREHPLPRLPDGRALGVSICFENAYPQHFARQARQGAGFFCVISNEAWYRLGAELDQMLAMTVLRALETGRPVVRSTTDGLTCLVEPDGRIAAGLGPGVTDVLAVTVQPRSGAQPPASWVGGWLPWLMLAVWVGLLLGPWSRLRRPTEPPSA
jgi:apolipoprotein N-acyltransferase